MRICLIFLSTTLSNLNSCYIIERLKVSLSWSWSQSQVWINPEHLINFVSAHTLSVPLVTRKLSFFFLPGMNETLSGARVSASLSKGLFCARASGCEAQRRTVYGWINLGWVCETNTFSGQVYPAPALRAIDSGCVWHAKLSSFPHSITHRPLKPYFQLRYRVGAHSEIWFICSAK